MQACRQGGMSPFMHPTRDQNEGGRGTVDGKSFLGRRKEESPTESVFLKDRVEKQRNEMKQEEDPVLCGGGSQRREEGGNGHDRISFGPPSPFFIPCTIFSPGLIQTDWNGRSQRYDPPVSAHLAVGTPRGRYLAVPTRLPDLLPCTFAVWGRVGLSLCPCCVERAAGMRAGSVTSRTSLEVAEQATSTHPPSAVTCTPPLVPWGALARNPLAVWGLRDATA
mmetsp:Transcript_40786/g.80371  ORF Transcript_40786/g.80371 Transcript_40786/m.80371 type:complete len:222 (-) Transcript_40786:471-1136(-)